MLVTTLSIHSWSSDGIDEISGWEEFWSQIKKLYN
jgi:hypothetical protein